jgi:pentatricopeptide repeat protein
MDHFVFATALNASASLAALEQGSQLHTHVVKVGFESDLFIKNALLDMYVKCGNLKDAQKVFDNMLDKEVISWNAMIAGYGQTGQGEKAMKLFFQMQIGGMDKDHFTYTSVLSASASLVAVEQGKLVHAHIIKTGYESNVSVGNTLVDMYAKCGSINAAHKVFENMPEKDVVSFNAIIAGYAHHGHGNEALRFFEQMQLVGMQPNDITFICILSACSHVGLVNEGCNYFNSMCRDHNIKPRMEHYACMVDLLSRAGCLYEVEEFIHEMPFKPGAVIWRTLLGACRVHGNIELGKLAAEYALELEPQDSATYVLLSNMFAAAGMWDEAENVRKLMRARKVKKEPGQSWIEIKNKMHTFIVGDRFHPQTEEIYAKLETLTCQMKGAGYIPDTSFVLHDYD